MKKIFKPSFKNKIKREKDLRIKVSFALISMCFLVFSARSVLALNNTDSEKSASDSSDQTVIDNVKKVIQEKKAEIKELGNNTDARQAYLAKIIRVSEETISVDSNGDSKIIPLSDKMKIYNFKDKKEIPVSKLAVDDWVAIYGKTETTTFNPEQVILYEQDFTPKEHQILLGSLAEIYPQSLAVNSRSNGEKVSFILDKNTVYQDSLGKEVDVDEFYKDLQCLIIASKNNRGDFLVSTIRALVEF